MSDGPVKSSKMPRHWRDFKNRASNSTYSLDQVSEAFEQAVKIDFRDAPLSDVRSILDSGEQGSPSLENRAGQLDKLSKSNRGSVIVSTLVDCLKK